MYRGFEIKVADGEWWAYSQSTFFVRRFKSDLFEAIDSFLG